MNVLLFIELAYTRVVEKVPFFIRKVLDEKDHFVFNPMLQLLPVTKMIKLFLIIYVCTHENIYD